MAKKPTTTTVASGFYSTTTLNNNFTALRDAFDNTLSLDGSTPNAMNADLDMNSNDLLNVGELDTESLRLNGVLVAPSSVVAAPQATGVNYNQGGTGAVNRTVASRLRESVSVKDFGAVGDGVTDDTVAIQAALDASVGKTVFFPSATYLCGDLVIDEFENTCIEGNGSTLKATPSCSRVLWIKRNVTRSNARFIRDLVIDGNSVAGVIGLQAGVHDDDTGSTLGAILYTKFDNILVKNCYTAFYLPVMMECSFDRCIAQFSTCGFWLRTSPIAGGCNANDFTGCSIYVCDLGFFMDNRSNNYGVANNIFTNLVIQGADLAAASINVTRTSLDGFYTEATSATAVTFDSFSFPACVAYFDKSSFEATSMNIAEITSPGIYLINGSVVSLGDVTGYGTSGDIFQSHSADDAIVFQGSYTALGVTDATAVGWPSFAATVLNNSYAVRGIPSSMADGTIPNNYVLTNSSTPTLQNAAGGSVINGTVADQYLGFASEVQFAASIGSAGSNRITIPAFSSAITAGNFFGASALVRASVASAIRFISVPNSGLNATFNIGTEWTRIVLLGRAASSTAGSNLYVWPEDAAGAALKIARLNTYSTASKALHQDYGTRLLAGAWNPGVKTEVFSSAIPTIGTWKVGDVVWNTAPASAGFIGWVCTAAGTPGTWKGFGVIA